MQATAPSLPGRHIDRSHFVLPRACVRGHPIINGTPNFVFWRAPPHSSTALARTDFHKVCVCVVDFGSTPALALCFGHQAWCCSPVAALCTVTNIGRPPVTSLPAAAAVAVRRVAARRGVRGDFPGLWRHSSARQCLRTSSVERLSTRTSPSRLARALVVLLLLLEPQRHSSRHRQSL